MTDKIGEAEKLAKTMPTDDKKADVENMTAALNELIKGFNPVAGLKEENKPVPNPDPDPKPTPEVKATLADATDLNKGNNLTVLDSKYVYIKGISKGLSYRIIGTNPD